MRLRPALVRSTEILLVDDHSARYDDGTMWIGVLDLFPVLHRWVLTHGQKGDHRRSRAVPCRAGSGPALEAMGSRRSSGEVRSGRLFCSKLSDALRHLSDPAQIKRPAMRVLGEHHRVACAQSYEGRISRHGVRLLRRPSRADCPLPYDRLRQIHGAVGTARTQGPRRRGVEPDSFDGPIDVFIDHISQVVHDVSCTPRHHGHVFRRGNLGDPWILM